MHTKTTLLLTVATIALSLHAGELPAPEKPDTAFIQMLRPGQDGLPKVFNTIGLAASGDYFYAAESANWSPASISYFKRDAQSGKLTWLGNLPTLEKHAPGLCVAGGRLYVLYQAYANYALGWFDLDATGKPVEKGKENLDKIEWAGNLIADPEGKNLYLWGSQKILWFKIDADGKPVKSGEVPGKGMPRWGSGCLCMSPDGKFLYAVNGEENAIACVERKADGSIAYKKSFDLSAFAKRAENAKPSGTLSISSSGKWLYVALFHSTAGGSFGVFKRDADSGELTLQEGGSGNESMRPDFKLSNLRTLNLVFFPGDTGGYVSTTSGALLQTFKCDPATGHLSDISDVTAIDEHQFSSASLLLDSKLGILYGTGENGTARAIWLLKTPAKLEQSGPRADLQLPVIGTQAAPAAVAASEWPHWRGPEYNGKNSAKGILKDWSNGLKKVWEVKGLSPGTCTFSAPCIKGDKLVVMGRHGNIDELFCFDADKGGAPLWIAEIPTNDGSDYGWGDGPQSTPCISDDKVYFASRWNNFACASMADGKILWKKDIGRDNHGYGAGPLVWDDLVIIVFGENKQLSAYKKDTGEKVWSYGDGPGGEGMLGYVSPLRAKFGDQEQIVCLAGKHAFGLDHATGKLLWELPFSGGGQYCAPMLAANTALFLSNQELLAVQFENGKATELWRKKEKDEGFCMAGHSEPLEIDGFIYTFADRDFMGGVVGDLKCIELKTGKAMWTEKNTGCGTMVAVDGCLLCLSFSGDLFLVDPKPDGFKKIAEWKGAIKHEGAWMHHGTAYRKTPAPAWTVPVVARGKVYLRYNDTLSCYEFAK